MFRILLPFAAGILYAMNAGYYSTIPFIAVIILSASGMLFRILLAPAFNTTWLSGLWINLCFFCAGAVLHNLQDSRSAVNYFTKHQESRFLLIRIDEPGAFKPYSVQFKGSVLASFDSCRQQLPASGKVLIRIRRQANSILPGYGNMLLIKRSLLQPVPPPPNPGMFDYRNYLAMRQVHHMARLSPAELKIVGRLETHSLLKAAYAVQEHLRQTLAAYIPKAEEHAVAQALLYGNDDEISKETVNAYARTGTLHVLAVSGMHVGIIFAILGKLLSPFDKLKYARFIKYPLLLFCLWSYALICGWTPSILRATVMFSFMIAGSIIKKPGNIYNTLCASTFFLLCTDTRMLANTGFQLSYLAVLGIVFFHPYVRAWWLPSKWVFSEIWKLASVSIAAQLATFPAGLLYFHQLSNCFLPANLIIIPLTTVILYGSLLLLPFSLFPLVAAYLGKVLEYLITITNKIALFLESLPYAYTDDLLVSPAQIWLLYGMLFAFSGYFILRRIGLLYAGSLCLLIFSAIHSISIIRSLQQQLLMVYDAGNLNAIRLISGTSSLLLADSGFLGNETSMRFHIHPHALMCRIKHERLRAADSSWKQVHFKGLNILVSGNGYIRKTSADLLIVRNRLPFHTLDSIQCRSVVISASVYPYTAERIANHFSSRKIPCHMIAQSGAFQLSLQ